MKIRYDIISDVGRVRSNNEDMALVFGAFIRDDAQRSMVPMHIRPRFTALVADGMGGYGGGEIASEMTLRSFHEFLNALPAGLTPREVTQSVKDWFRVNQEAVLAKAASDPELNQMGTTLTGIFTYAECEYMLNAGDSRVYRWRYDTLRQLSTDHSERERTGDPTVPSNLIYNAVGVPGAFIDVTNLTSEMPVIDGDVYVICSDGLCDMIDDDRIAAILAEGGGARELVDAALEAGGRDNCTVIVLHVAIPEEDTAPQETPEEEAPHAEQPAKEEAQPTPPPFKGFCIDSPVTDAPDAPTPPPIQPEYSEAPGVNDEEISEEEALRLEPGEPTAGERRKMISRRWMQILFGRK